MNKSVGSASALLALFSALGIAVVIGMLTAIDQGWIAETPYVSEPAVKPAEPPIATAARCDKPREERILHLPEDSAKWYLTLVLAPDDRADPASRKLRAWFASDPRLASLKAQTHFNEYRPDERFYRARYLAHYGATTPQVWLQRDNAKPIYCAQGTDMPTSAEALADELAEVIQQACPNCPRPSPDDDDVDVATPSDAPSDGGVPIIRPKPQSSLDPRWVGAAVCLAIPLVAIVFVVFLILIVLAYRPAE